MTARADVRGGKHFSPAPVVLPSPFVSTSPSPSTSPSSHSTVIRVVVIGGPCVGKTTLCQRLSSALGVPIISVAEALRKSLANKSPYGQEARGTMEKGVALSDRAVVGLLEEDIQRCGGYGWIIDGFPRTASQCIEFLSSGSQLRPDVVILLTASLNIILDRADGRRIDPATGDIFHDRYSQGRLPADRLRLTKRSDDDPAMIKRRLQQWDKEISSIEQSFRQSNIKVLSLPSTESSVKSIMNLVRDAERAIRDSIPLSSHQRIVGVESRVGSMEVTLCDMQSMLMRLAASIEKLEKDQERLLAALGSTTFQTTCIKSAAISDSPTSTNIRSNDEKSDNSVSKVVSDASSLPFVRREGWVVEDDSITEVTSAVELANAAVRGLKQRDIGEFRRGVRTSSDHRIVEALCLLLGEPASWSVGCAVMSERGFKARLCDIDCSKISRRTLSSVKSYVDDPALDPYRRRGSESVAAVLANWVRAMYTCGRVLSEKISRIAQQKQKEVRDREMMIEEARLRDAELNSDDDDGNDSMWASNGNRAVVEHADPIDMKRDHRQRNGSSQVTVNSSTASSVTPKTVTLPTSINNEKQRRAISSHSPFTEGVFSRSSNTSRFDTGNIVNVGGRCFIKYDDDFLMGVFTYEKGSGIVLWSWSRDEAEGPSCLPSLILSGASDWMHAVQTRAERRLWIDETSDNPLSIDLIRRYDPLYAQRFVAARRPHELWVYLRINGETIQVSCTKQDTLNYLISKALAGVVTSNRETLLKRGVKGVRFAGRLLDAHQTVGEWFKNGDVGELVF